MDCRFDGAAPLCCTAGGTFEPQALARAYLKIRPGAEAAETTGDDESDDSSMQAFDCVDEMIEAAPETAVVFILAALDVCRTAAQVAVLGAGPLEKLLQAHGLAVIRDLEREARKHAKVRYLLSATWGRDHIDAGVWERLVIAVTPGPVMDGDARTPAAGLRDKILDAAGVVALLAAPMA